MQIIILSKGEIALVDNEDYPYISLFKWYLSNGYAINEYRQKMHRLILKALPGQLVDHEDHNRLNNQKYNIRIANRFQNIHNQHKRTNTKNRYKGTNFVKPLGLWQSRCRMFQKDYFLGHYKSEIAAAYAYNKKAKELSNFALLNEFNYSVEYLEKMLISDRVTPPKQDKQSGIKYIYWSKWNKKWQITYKGKFNGYFKDLNLAKERLNYVMFPRETRIDDELKKISF